MHIVIRVHNTLPAEVRNTLIKKLEKANVPDLAVQNKANLFVYEDCMETRCDCLKAAGVTEEERKKCNTNFYSCALTALDRKGDEEENTEVEKAQEAAAKLPGDLSEMPEDRKKDKN